MKKWTKGNEVFYSKAILSYIIIKYLKGNNMK